MRAPALISNLPRLDTLAVIGAALMLTACPVEEPPPPVTDTDTGEPSCLDTDSPGPDIVINFNSDIEELQLGECVPERIVITGGGVTNLTGLSNLREVGILEIRFAPMLTTLTGLEDLQRVDTLIITGNSVMPTLLEWDDLATVGTVIITSNDGLTDLGSFPALTSAKRLEITSNEDLTDYSGFEELTMLSGGLDLSDSPLITDFTGLEKLTTVGGDMNIQDNAVLLSFDGLGVTSVGGDLSVVSNEDLSECLVMDFADATNVGGAKILNGNKMDLCD